MSLDRIDIAILEALQKDGRISNAALAERVGQHEDRLRDAELAQAAMRTAVAEATKETAVLIEQNRWISASLERIEKRVNTLGS